MSGGKRAVLTVCVWLAASSGSGLAESAPPVDWRSTIGRDHPLAGAIISTGALEPARAIDPKEFIAKLAAADATLLGEVHDNDDHHRWQAWIASALRERVKAPRAVALVFEQVRTDQQGVLDEFAERAAATQQPSLDELKGALKWDRSGWSANGYDPLLQIALDGAAYAGDPPRETVKKIAKDGAGALPDNERARLRLDEPLGPEQDAASLSEIEAAHCGLMPKTALAPMANAQRFRDAVQADAVLKAVEKHGAAILIAGAGHVRADRGAPWYMRRMSPETKLIAVMLAEVEPGRNDPADYAPRASSGAAVVDYLIFTPAVDRGDPCANMPARLSK